MVTENFLTTVFPAFPIGALPHFRQGVRIWVIERARVSVGVRRVRGELSHCALYVLYVPYINITNIRHFQV